MVTTLVHSLSYTRDVVELARYGYFSSTLSELHKKSSWTSYGMVTSTVHSLSYTSGVVELARYGYYSSTLSQLHKICSWTS